LEENLKLLEAQSVDDRRSRLKKEYKKIIRKIYFDGENRWI